MKVVKYGHIKPKKLECRSCGATLEYTPADVKTKQLLGREHTFIDCPVCGVRTDVKGE